MALVRCTCVYRALPGGTDPEHPTPYTVITRDPFCPSAELHARASEPTEAGEPARD